ncbi:MAG: histone deacetylase, partial [Planctomycetes bacterium]|nr:histone deacetylase [Planctomycetota bacterium]
HASPAHIYPGTGFDSERGVGEGEGASCNVTLPLGTDGDVWYEKFQEYLNYSVEEHQPHFLLVGAGFDAHKDDPYGVLNVSDEHYFQAIHLLAQVADKYCQNQWGLFLEGGYNLDVLKRLVPRIISHLAD